MYLEITSKREIIFNNCFHAVFCYTCLQVYECLLCTWCIKFKYLGKTLGACRELTEKLKEERCFGDLFVFALFRRKKKRKSFRFPTYSLIFVRCHCLSFIVRYHLYHLFIHEEILLETLTVRSIMLALNCSWTMLQ